MRDLRRHDHKDLMLIVDLNNKEVFTNRSGYAKMAGISYFYARDVFDKEFTGLLPESDVVLTKGQGYREMYIISLEVVKKWLQRYESKKSVIEKLNSLDVEQLVEEVLENFAT